MRLQRNTDPDGLCRYFAIDTRKLDCRPKTPEEALASLQRCPEALIMCKKGDDNEFFLIMFKDINAEDTFKKYAEKASRTDITFANDVIDMSKRAGPNHRLCKVPD